MSARQYVHDMGLVLPLIIRQTDHMLLPDAVRALSTTASATGLKCQDPI